ncbi:MAG: bifunctional diaminohydroxyphosphoribosylaminopyrimidine deaminase/5-amino-6-(5-phosphoribosylamino)uracil reductase RibD [Planctomycetes bacterium]|jgi:diaminohydroxyphosphoribosylaminopyrimidine deaminase/5-amino-6-(5-phosphoribosylamino)uracil reductase|nr:bifunctional diaminohydroxyphosphoribosylaminopyrimidine deaminase/5-amino-6-(5-phosphoribosylamino)uracil reductase RibD [Planctomycetota bacterium]
MTAGAEGTDIRFMNEALRLAESGRFRVEPNPVVGAIIVRGESCIGTGFHAAYGADHAEVVALREAGGEARGATLYVTLEPCAHRGKTPPCVEAVLASGIRRVVYGANDPNPRTAGRGPEILRAAGLEVCSGVLAAEAAALNPGVEVHLRGDLPWTIAKWAMTLDGKIADVAGGSRSISGAEAHRLVHDVRGAVDAVAVGIGTVLADDPLLTARGVELRRRATRVVLDTRLRIPMGGRLVATAREWSTVVIAGQQAPPEHEQRLVEAGCRVVRFREEGGRLPLVAVFRRLRSEGMERILLEGGGEIHAAAFSAGVVRQVMAFVAPVLLGGRTAPTPLQGDGFRRIADPVRLGWSTFRSVGPDLLVEGYVQHSESGAVAPQ